MKAAAHFSRSVIGVGLVTGLILLVPLVAMFFTTEVQWGPFDFLLIGVLLFSTGISYQWVTQRAPNVLYKLAAGVAFLCGFGLIWANLAVGLIGSGANMGNLLYAAVVAIAIAGVALSRLEAGGLSLAMYVTSLALVVHTSIAFMANMQNYPGSSAGAILAVNGFFASGFFAAGVLFRLAAKKADPAG